MLKSAFITKDIRRVAFLLVATVMTLLLVNGQLASAQTASQGTLDANCDTVTTNGFVPIWGGAKAAQTFTAQSTGKLTSAQASKIFRFSGGTGGTSRWK